MVLLQKFTNGRSEMLTKMRDIARRQAPTIIDQNQVPEAIDALPCTIMCGLDFLEKKTSNSMPLIVGDCSVGQHSR